MRGGQNAKPKKNIAPGVGKRAELPLPQMLPAVDRDTTEIPLEIRPLFDEVIESLENRGLQNVDRDQVRSYAMLVHLQRLAEADILERGLWVDTINGERPNPSIKTLRDASAQSLRIASEFGLTTASRLRLGLSAPSNLSGLQFLNAQLEEMRS